MNRELRLGVAYFLLASVWGQDQAPLTEKAKQLEEAKREGIPIEVDLTVGGNASVEAVLLPPAVCKRVFGKEISQNYAAIHLTISNRSKDASLIVHSVFLDYSGWAFSGSRRGASSASDQNQRETWQTATKRNQVASVEYRVARGQMLDAQPWTARSWTMRVAEFIAIGASAYSFGISEMGIVKGIAAFGGQVVPALNNAWPDQTIGQLNRISDFGFQVNKVIPKESADVLVAFFPIDRFMTPSLKEAYLKAPAVFFASYALIVDPKAQNLLWPLLKPLAPDETKESFVQKLLDAYFHRTKAQQGDTAEETKKYLGILDFLDRTSLNNIRTVVGGTMSVDLDSVAPTIESVEFDGGNNSPEVWLDPGLKKGTIKGRFLAGAKPVISNAEELGIKDVTALKEGSTDRELRFSMKLEKSIKSEQVLNFVLSRTMQNGQPLESKPYLVKVTYGTVGKDPKIEGVKVVDGRLKITGDNFFDNDLKVTLKASENPDATDHPVEKLAARTLKEITVDLSSLALKPACWLAEVKVATLKATSPKAFAQTAAAASIDEAKWSSDGKQVIVAGKELLDLKACGVPLTFQVVENKAGAKAVDVKAAALGPKQATLDFAKPSTGGPWKVSAKFGETAVEGKEIK